MLIEGDYDQQLSEIITQEKGVVFRQALTDKLVERLLAAEEDEAGS